MGCIFRFKNFKRMNCIPEQWCREKPRKINYKGQCRQKIEPEEWIRVEGTHEPIVSKKYLNVCRS